MSNVPIGHSVLSKDCVRNALNKIKDSTCVKLVAKLDEKEGYFIVCKGRLIDGKWKDKKGEEAWNELIEEASRADSVLKINFYPPPEDVDVIEEMSADALAVEDVGSEYVASVSVLVNPDPRPSPDQVRSIASLYLSDLGIKEIEVEMA